MVMEATPSAQSVGREFVKQYYTLLNIAPHHLHRFYNNNSSFIHGGLNAMDRAALPAIGQKEIHRKITELEFRDCHTKITQVDAQSTLADGVVVQVTGELSNAGEPMRRFTQTFVLAAQAPKTYYVHNDIFRYQDLGIYDEEENEPGQSETSEREIEDVRSENDDDGGGSIAVTHHVTNVVQTLPEQQVQHPSIIQNQQPNITHVYYPPPQQQQQQVHPNMQPVINGSIHEDSPLMNQQQQPQPQQLPPQQQQQQQAPILTQQVEPQPPQQQVPSVVPTYENDTINQEQFIQETEVITEKPAPVGIVNDEVVVNTTNDDVVSHENHQKIDNFQENIVVEKNQPRHNSVITNIQPIKPMSYAGMISGNSLQQSKTAAMLPRLMNATRIDEQRTSTIAQSNQNTQSAATTTATTNSTSSSNQQNQRLSNQSSSQREQREQQQQQHQQSSSQNRRDNQQQSRGGQGGQGSYANAMHKENRRRDWPDHHQLFVGNVPHQASESELRIIFERFGKVVDLHIHCKTTGGKGPQGQNNSTRVPNYGFVTFEDYAVVAKVLEALPICYPDDKGLKLNIEEKKNKPRGPGEGGNMRSNTNEGNVRSSMGGGQQQQQQQQQQQRGQGGPGGSMRAGGQHGARVNRGGFSRTGDRDGNRGPRQQNNMAGDGGAPNYQNRR
ncbi:hypothetical protein HCN44_003230 [Aphidius gifuensis]|uniref:Uncharacterized protein n=1 Tax=Aphidius gifuensis TaxID=684658 RepID=A0A835CMV0_APHGI|nr:ras GTPase-activating protein-binding protein 2 [Aphidius gifuensis]KAF7987468.1 hypothetical protein HCN44_003230 [Aphidius gifuensis]